MVTESRMIGVDPRAVATLLRGLAFDVEASPALAGRVLHALVTTGLLDEEVAPAEQDAAVMTDLLGLSAARIDLTALFRQGGPEGVRERLITLPMTALRRVIQMRQLDPERQSSRLRSTAKLIDFIVARVANQMDRERELTRAASWML